MGPIMCLENCKYVAEVVIKRRGLVIVIDLGKSSVTLVRLSR
jgi:hypothetical protein